MDRSDRQRFDGALGKLLFATDGTIKLSPHIAGTYWFVLKQFDWPAVSAGMTQAITQSTGHVSPATLANFCRPAPGDVMHAANENRAHDLEQRLQSADHAADVAGEKRFGELWYSTEFRDVLRVANMEFGRKCNGRIPGGIRIPTPDTFGYHGPFEYAPVVAAMVKPMGKTTPSQAAAAWESFWCVLVEEFTKYREAL